MEYNKGVLVAMAVCFVIGYTIGMWVHNPNIGMGFKTDEAAIEAMESVK